METFQTIIIALGSGAITALITGLLAIRKIRVERQLAKEDETDVARQALRYLMLYIIQDQAKAYIAAGTITLDQLRVLHKQHDLYHSGLGGNGDANRLMMMVEALQITTD